MFTCTWYYNRLLQLMAYGYISACWVRDCLNILFTERLQTASFVQTTINKTPKDSSFTVMNDKEKQQFLTFKIVETSKRLTFNQQDVNQLTVDSCSTSGSAMRQWSWTLRQSTQTVFSNVRQWSILHRPSLSPDLSPNDHVFHLLKTRLRENKPLKTRTNTFCWGKTSARHQL